MEDIDPRLIEAARAAGIHVPERPTGPRPEPPISTAGKEPILPVLSKLKSWIEATHEGEFRLCDLLDLLRDLSEQGSPEAGRCAAALGMVSEADLEAIELTYDSDGDEFTISTVNPNKTAIEDANARTQRVYHAAHAVWAGQYALDRAARTEYDRACAPFRAWDRFIESTQKAAAAANDPQAAALAAIGRALPLEKP